MAGSSFGTKKKSFFAKETKDEYLVAVKPAKHLGKFLQAAELSRYGRTNIAMSQRNLFVVRKRPPKKPTQGVFEILT